MEKCNERHLSLREASSRAVGSHSYISAIISGRVKSPRVSSLVKLAKFFREDPALVIQLADEQPLHVSTPRREVEEQLPSPEEGVTDQRLVDMALEWILQERSRAMEFFR